MDLSIQQLTQIIRRVVARARVVKMEIIQIQGLNSVDCWI